MLETTVLGHPVDPSIVLRLMPSLWMPLLQATSLAAMLHQIPLFQSFCAKKWFQEKAFSTFTMTAHAVRLSLKANESIDAGESPRQANQEDALPWRVLHAVIKRSNVIQESQSARNVTSVEGNAGPDLRTSQLVAISPSLDG
jgi:hypothetical protein